MGWGCTPRLSGGLSPSSVLYMLCLRQQDCCRCRGRASCPPSAELEALTLAARRSNHPADERGGGVQVSVKQSISGYLVVFPSVSGWFLSLSHFSQFNHPSPVDRQTGCLLHGGLSRGEPIKFYHAAPGRLAVLPEAVKGARCRYSPFFKVCIF